MMSLQYHKHSSPFFIRKKKQTNKQKNNNKTTTIKQQLNLSLCEILVLIACRKTHIKIHSSVIGHTFSRLLFSIFVHGLLHSRCIEITMKRIEN